MWLETEFSLLTGQPPLQVVTAGSGPGSSMDQGPESHPPTLAPVEGVTTSCLGHTPSPSGNDKDTGALMGACPPGAYWALCTHHLTHFCGTLFACSTSEIKSSRCDSSEILSLTGGNPEKQA